MQLSLILRNYQSHLNRDDEYEDVLARVLRPGPVDEPNDVRPISLQNGMGLEDGVAKGRDPEVVPQVSVLRAPTREEEPERRGRGWALGGEIQILDE